MSTKNVQVSLPVWQCRELNRRFPSIQDGLRAATTMLLTEGRRATRSSRYQEVSLTPRSGSSVDAMLTYLAAGAPTVGDLLTPGDNLDSSLVAAVKAALPKMHARRVLRRLEGASITVIGREDGVSKQAVHKSLKAAAATLGRDRAFTVALCAIFPESGLTPALLMEASTNG
jgi:hypothetical protein